MCWSRGCGRHHLCRAWCFLGMPGGSIPPSELELAFRLGFDSPSGWTRPDLLCEREVWWLLPVTSLLRCLVHVRLYLSRYSWPEVRLLFKLDWQCFGVRFSFSFGTSATGREVLFPTHRASLGHGGFRNEASASHRSARFGVSIRGGCFSWRSCREGRFVQLLQLLL